MSLIRTVSLANRVKSPVLDSWLSVRVRLLLADRVMLSLDSWLSVRVRLLLADRVMLSLDIWLALRVRSLLADRVVFLLDSWLALRVRLLLADRKAVCAVRSLTVTSPGAIVMPELVKVTVSSPLSVNSVA